LQHGWLDTGDLGYWSEGELVVTGRAKDLIIVNGRNIWPQDIEWAIEALPRLRRGDACAFSLQTVDSEEVVVLDRLSSGFDWSVPPEARLYVGDVGDSAGRLSSCRRPRSVSRRCSASTAPRPCSSTC